MRKKIIYIIGIILGCSQLSFGQSDLVKFGAISRGVVQESTLEDSDTTNPNRDNSGEVVVDLKLNINPNKKTEIGTVVRLESDLGGFFGAGSAISLRQLYVKGTVYDAISYELGDIYLELSPYTLYNTNGESDANEAKVFSQLREDFNEYDNFNIGNAWWSQGGHVNFGLEFDSLANKGAQFDLFTSRVVSQSTSRFLAGGRASLFDKSNYYVKANLVQLFDAKRVNPSEESLRNTVASLEWEYILDLGKGNLLFNGETGFSTYKISEPVDSDADLIVPEDRDGQFVNAGLDLETKDKKVKIGAKFLRNGSQFFSAGAQTKRLDFTAEPDLFQNVANDPFNNRELNIYDVIANQNFYNPEISSTLQTYNPLYGNTTPYGIATPNRQGVIISGSYADSAKVFDANVEAALLADVVGVGTEEKRNFTKLSANVNLNLADLIGYKKQFKIYGGAVYEQTSRDGDLSAIDLTTTHIDGGLDIEILKKLSLLGGIKLLTGSGNEFLYDFSDRNLFTIPTSFNVDENQTLTGIGLRYQFSDNTYLTIKNYNLSVNNNLSSDEDYSFNQWMLFFSLKL